MPSRLSGEETVTIEALTAKGQNHCEAARTLGVTEGTVRYLLRRTGTGKKDGRKEKAFKAEAVSSIIAAWLEAREGSPCPVNVQELYEHLMWEWNYKRFVPIGAAVHATPLRAAGDPDVPAGRDTTGGPEPDELGGIPADSRQARSSRTAHFAGDAVHAKRGEHGGQVRLPTGEGS